MHGRYEDITKADFTLSEPSQMIRGQGMAVLAFVQRAVTGMYCHQDGFIVRCYQVSILQQNLGCQLV